VDGTLLLGLPQSPSRHAPYVYTTSLLPCWHAWVVLR